MSLTDDLVREALTDITIKLLNANVIPWDDIILAIKTHGLVLDVTKFTLTNPEVRQGLASFVLELIPGLIRSGSLTTKQVVEQLNIETQRPFPGKGEGKDLRDPRIQPLGPFPDEEFPHDHHEKTTSKL